MTWLLRSNRGQRAQAADGPVVEMGWTGRLQAIGRLLDGHRAPLRDVSVTTTGTQGWLVALAFQENLTYGTWRPISLPIAEDRTAAVEPPASPSRTSQTARADRFAPGQVVRSRPWASRLRAIGALLDRSDVPLRDVCVLEVNGGFVVQALAPSFVDGNTVWTLTSREFPETDVTAAAATLPDPATARFAHPWRVCAP